MVEMAPQFRGTPASRQTPTIRSASARVWHMGLSVTTALAPFSTARRTSSGRLLVFVAIATMSSFSFSSISAPSVYSATSP